jgi:hypothetical protein
MLKQEVENFTIKFFRRLSGLLKSPAVEEYARNENKAVSNSFIIAN